MFYIQHISLVITAKIKTINNIICLLLLLLLLPLLLYYYYYFYFLKFNLISFHFILFYFIRFDNGTLNCPRCILFFPLFSSFLNVLCSRTVQITTFNLSIKNFQCKFHRLSIYILLLLLSSFSVITIIIIITSYYKLYEIPSLLSYILSKCFLSLFSFFFFFSHTYLYLSTF